MALQYKVIHRIYCGICGYYKDYDPNDLEVSLPGICPACQDGKSKVWQRESKKKWKEVVHDRWLRMVDEYERDQRGN